VVTARLVGWSPARFAFPLFLGFEAFVLITRTAQWRGEWAWTIDWVGGITVLLGPFVAGLSAWRAVAVRDMLGEVGGLIGPWRAQRAEYVAIVGWAWLAHLIGLAVGLGMTAAAGAPGWAPLAPVLPHFAAIAGYAALGLILGTLVPNPLIAPLTGLVMLFAVTEFSAGVLPALWVYVGGATSSLAGLHDNPWVLAAQTGLGAGWAVIGLSVSRLWSGRLRARWAAVPGAAAVVLCAGWLATNPAHYLPNHDTGARTCFGDRPSVCLLRESAASGPAVQHSLSALTAYAESLGARGLPARFVQVAPTSGELEGRSFVLNPGAVTNGVYAAEDAAHYFVYDRRCTDAPPADAIDSLTLVSEYVAIGAHLVTAEQVSDPMLTGLRRLPATARDRWVVRVLAAAGRCSYAGMRLPAGLAAAP